MPREPKRDDLSPPSGRPGAPREFRVIGGERCAWCRACRKWQPVGEFYRIPEKPFIRPQCARAEIDRIKAKIARETPAEREQRLQKVRIYKKRWRTGVLRRRRAAA